MYKVNYWDTLFKNRSSILPHEKYLEDYQEYFKDSKILDVGAGEGRNTLFLAKNAQEIDSIDYSEEGIKKLKTILVRNSIKGTVIAIDIEQNKIELKKVYTTICFIHYFPGVEKLVEFDPYLEADGQYIVLTFLKEYVDQESAKYSIGIDQKGIEAIESRYAVKVKKEYEDERGRQIGMVIKKKN